MLSVQGGPHCRGESADVDLADGIRLEVGVSSQPDLQRGQEIPRQSANAWLHFADPAALAQAESLYVEPLRDFVLFATRRPTYVTSMTIYRDQALRDGLRLLRSPHPQPTELATRPVDALALNLRDIADPAAMLARWFELRQQVGPVWSLLFSTLQGGGLLEDASSASWRSPRATTAYCTTTRHCRPSSTSRRRRRSWTRSKTRTRGASAARH